MTPKEPNALHEQEFLASFLQKRTAFLLTL
jgi:hypothetical protein